MPFTDIEAKRAYQRAYLERPGVRTRRAAYYETYSAKNKDHLLAREAKRRLEKRGQSLVANARTRSKKKHLAFDLDAHVADIQARIDAGRCELTGALFDVSPGRKFNSPSIDRINPRKGYLYSNIRIVLHLVNAALGDWGEQPLRTVMDAWLNTELADRRRVRLGVFA